MSSKSSQMAAIAVTVLLILSLITAVFIKSAQLDQRRELMQSELSAVKAENERLERLLEQHIDYLLQQREGLREEVGRVSDWQGREYYLQE